MSNAPEIWDDVASEWEMACPDCGHGDELNITALTVVRLVLDGTTDDALGCGGHEWDDGSDCHCLQCGWEGKVGEARGFYAENTTEDGQ